MIYENPVQDVREWRAYLSFIRAYFDHLEVNNPTIVEIGVYKNKQKMHYEKIGFSHIGVDINPESNADIIGDSHQYETVDKVKKMLCGKKADVIFIDGDHEYWSVKRDYELFAPLAKSVIVLHDIIHYQYSVAVFWNGLIAANMERCDKTFITIQSWRMRDTHHLHRLGIGIILIEGQEDSEAGWFVV